MELYVRVSALSTNPPPTLPTPIPLLPPDVLYTAPGELLTHNITIQGGGSILGTHLSNILPLPEGSWLGPLKMTTSNSGK